MVDHPSCARSEAPVSPEFDWPPVDFVADWLAQLRSRVAEHVDESLQWGLEELRTLADTAFAADLVREFVAGGKRLRSTFGYLGWLCGCAESPAALRAAASLELFHGFALVQDDVMDESRSRRGRSALHVRLSEWHQQQHMNGSAARFGESAAILLSDLCLVWAERAFRDSGVDPAALGRAWPHYDLMRTEVAAGQYGDLLNEMTRRPSLPQVLDVISRKSANYTVRRPLEIGAALAGCDTETMRVLGAYGSAVGKAFQIRDDLLGVFGAQEDTGKPVGDDLRRGKATTVVTLARELASPAAGARMDELARADELDDESVGEWCELIDSTKAPRRLEQMITDEVDRALANIANSRVDDFVAQALRHMAVRCSARDS